MKTEFPVGRLYGAKRPLSLNLSLKLAREQFSDMVRLLEANRLKDLHFTVEEKKKSGSWPVHAWGIQIKK
jgi:hypothetical protein